MSLKWTASAPVTRRQILGKAAGLGLAAAAVAVVGPTITTARSSDALETTDRVNLRTGPGTTYRVIVVLPKGAILDNGDQTSNGYRKVTYKGTTGWASEAYLKPAGGPVVLGTRVATRDLNVRSGPSTGHQVLDVLDQGATVSITDQVYNGYRYIIQHSGPAGWVLDSGLGTGGQPSGTLKATANLNLREQPSTSAKVLVVIPAGATVRAGDQRSNGFRQVTYNGKAGWASEAYLR